DMTVPEMCPSWDMPWELVRLGASAQITAVIVAGRLRLWQGWPLDWDGPALVRQAAKVAAEVVARAPVTRAHPTSAEHRTRSARQ
ncbi:MAG: amidohydrolase, partial [Haloechinothrix sp.]